MTKLTDEEIVNSEAFKVLNFMIDEKATQLKGMLLSFKSRVDNIFRESQKFVPTIDTRISYEEGGRAAGSVVLAAHTHELKDLKWYLDEVAKLEEGINSLQRMKLQLVNDYDFTHGDPTTQKAIFGNHDKSHSNNP